MWNQKIKFTALLMGSLVLSGCGTTYDVVYESMPEGAMVVCNGERLGVAPVKKTYKVGIDLPGGVTPHEDGKWVDIDDDCIAVWRSNAIKAYPRTVPYYTPGASDWANWFFTGSLSNNGIKVTAPRPMDVPGIEQDTEWAKYVLVKQGMSEALAQQRAIAAQNQFDQMLAQQQAQNNALLNQQMQSLGAQVNQTTQSLMNFNSLGNSTNGPGVYNVNRLQDNLYQVRKVK